MNAVENGAEFKQLLTRSLIDMKWSEKRPNRVLQNTTEKYFVQEMFVGTNPYRKRRRTDICMFHPVDKGNASLVVEAKHQSTTGTADEKFPFVALTAEEGDTPTLLVLGGRAIDPMAVDFMRSMISSKFVGVIHVYDVLDIRCFGEWIANWEYEKNATNNITGYRRLGTDQMF